MLVGKQRTCHTTVSQRRVQRFFSNMSPHCAVQESVFSPACDQHRCQNCHLQYLRISGQRRVLLQVCELSLVSTTDDSVYNVSLWFKNVLRSFLFQDGRSAVMSIMFLSQASHTHSVLIPPAANGDGISRAHKQTWYIIYIILYYIILYYIIYYILLYYIILYCIILYYILLYFIIVWKEIHMYINYTYTWPHHIFAQEAEKKQLPPAFNPSWMGYAADFVKSGPPLILVFPWESL